MVRRAANTLSVITAAGVTFPKTHHLGGDVILISESRPIAKLRHPSAGLCALLVKASKMLIADLPPGVHFLEKLPNALRLLAFRQIQWEINPDMHNYCCQGSRMSREWSKQI